MIVVKDFFWKALDDTALNYALSKQRDQTI